MSYSAPGIGIHFTIPHAVHTASEWACLSAYITPVISAAAYPTADLAIYIPMRIKERITVLRLFAAIGTASGNIDVGIYSAAGVLLVSSGSTAMSGSNTEQVFDVTDTVIQPGINYFAVTIDNTTATLVRDNDAAPNMAANGVLSEQLGTGAALPATATWEVPQTLAYYPLIGAFVEGTVT